MQRRFLIFQAAGERFALQLKDVAEVMEPKDTFPLPVAPRYFRGIIDFHGTLTAVLDLSLYLGRGEGGAGGKFLVLDPAAASLALWVEGVGAMLSEEGVLDLLPADDPLLEGVLETETGRIKLLQVEGLLAALEEGVAAALPEQNH